MSLAISNVLYRRPDWYDALHTPATARISWLTPGTVVTRPKAFSTSAVAQAAFWRSSRGNTDAALESTSNRR